MKEKLKQLKEHFMGNPFSSTKDNKSSCGILKWNEYCILKEASFARAFEMKLKEARVSFLPYGGKEDEHNIVLRNAGGSSSQLCFCTRPFGASSLVSIQEVIKRIDKRISKVNKKIRSK